MRQHEVEDSHAEWLVDIEYRQAFGSETAELEVAAALVDACEAAGMSQSALAEVCFVGREEGSYATTAF